MSTAPRSPRSSARRWSRLVLAEPALLAPNLQNDVSAVPGLERGKGVHGGAPWENMGKLPGRHGKTMVYKSKKLCLMINLGVNPSGTLTAAERREWMGMGVGSIINNYYGPFPHSLRLAPVSKLLHSYGKPPFLTGKSTISMAIFNSKLFVYQRVISMAYSAPITMVYEL